MTNPCFGFGQIHTNNATLVGVTSRCGAGDHIGFTPPLPHRSSPTCICIQPTIHISVFLFLWFFVFSCLENRSSPTCICIQPTIQQFSFFILTIWLWMTKNFQQPVWKKWRKSESFWNTAVIYLLRLREGRMFLKRTVLVLFATKREEKVFYKYLWDNVCKEMRGGSFWNTQFWCYLQ